MACDVFSQGFQALLVFMPHSDAQNRNIKNVLTVYLDDGLADHQGAHVNTRDLLLNHLLYGPHAEWVTAAVTWNICKHATYTSSKVKDNVTEDIHSCCQRWSIKFKIQLKRWIWHINTKYANKHLTFFFLWILPIRSCCLKKLNTTLHFFKLNEHQLSWKS